MTIPLKKRIRPNAKFQRRTSYIFLPILLAAYIYPLIGLLAFVCVFVGFTLTLRHGRKWCDWMCPRGSFFEVFLTPISSQKKLPNWFYSYPFRGMTLLIFFVVLSFNMYRTYPDAQNMTFAFVKMFTITTIVGTLLGLFFRPRSWCLICPVGIVTGFTGWKKKPLLIDSKKCINCTYCNRVCPMGLAPYKNKEEGQMHSLDCIKCTTCIENCPTKALSFSHKKIKTS